MKVYRCIIVNMVTLQRLDFIGDRYNVPRGYALCKSQRVR